MRRSDPSTSSTYRRLTGRRAGYRDIATPPQAGLSDRGQSFVRQQSNTRGTFSTPQIERIRQTQAAADTSRLAQYNDSLSGPSGTSSNLIDPSAGNYMPSHEGGEMQDALSHAVKSVSPAAVEDDDDWLTETEDAENPYAH